MFTRHIGKLNYRVRKSKCNHNLIYKFADFKKQNLLVYVAVETYMKILPLKVFLDMAIL